MRKHKKREREGGARKRKFIEKHNTEMSKFSKQADVSSIVSFFIQMQTYNKTFEQFATYL